jgi:hypothetical protein
VHVTADVIGLKSDGAGRKDVDRMVQWAVEIGQAAAVS